MNMMENKETISLCKDIVVQPFYSILSESIKNISSSLLLSRKNPYLVALRDNQSPDILAKLILDAHISSSEETILGNLLEKLAIAINAKKYGGYKAEEGKYVGIDLIFHKNEIKYMLSIKSGTKWGNADQKKAMKRNFAEARKLSIQEGWQGEVVFINGCIYGKSSPKEKSDSNFPDSNYCLTAGKAFWELISGESEMSQIVLESVTVATKDYFLQNGKRYEATYNSKLKEIENYIIEITKDENGKLNVKELAQAMLSN